MKVYQPPLFLKNPLLLTAAVSWIYQSQWLQAHPQFLDTFQSYVFTGAEGVPLSGKYHRGLTTSPQGTIVATGAMGYPPEFQALPESAVASLGLSRVMSVTSTYDHRIIQGAESGLFLDKVEHLLKGGDGFYDEIFRALRIPYLPIRWATDIATTHDDELSKTARVQQLIHAYRVRGHLMADIDPLEYRQRSHPDLDIANHGLTLWDLDREIATGGLGGKPFMKLRDIQIGRAHV